MSTTTSSTTTTTLSSTSSSVTDQFQTATAQAAATLMPSSSTATTTKKMSNFFHCNSGNNNMNITTTTTTGSTTTTTTGSSITTTTTTNIRTNNVKLRLKEKTKKKLEEKSGTTAATSNGSNASAAAAAAAACLSGIVQETITTTTFSKIHDQMAAMATSDPALTMELLGASLNMNPSVVTDQFHHNHHHHQHHHHFHHQQHHQSSSTKTGSCGTSPSRNNSSSTTATTNLNKSQQQQQQRQPLTMKLKKLCNPSATNIITSNHQNRRQEDCCTKKDDCHCQACIQRQKIAEELIAEEESSKKKKQKKKKNKSSKQKKDNDKKDDDNDGGDGDDGEQEKVATKDDQKNELRIQENLKSDQKQNVINESPMDVKIITEQQSNKPQQQQSATKQTKKNKKNKSNVEKLNVGEAKSSATAKTTATTTTAAPKEEKKKSTLSNNNSNSSNILNDSNGDPIAVDIQQWIKVKNKSKQQPSSSLNSGIININNNTDWIVDDDITTTTTTTTMSDSIDNNLNNDDIDDSLMDHQQQQNNGFKIIHSDKSRKSYSNDNSDLSLSSTTTTQTLNINDGGNVSGGLGLGSRTIIGLNSAVAASKAKLLAIEAQIAHSNNELKGAVQYISEALEIDSKNPIYYINRAYYHERLNEFEHALRDTESAIRFDECRDHFDHAICLKARCLIGLEQYEQAEQLLFRLKSLSQKFIPFLHKDLLLLRMKKLISCGYTIPLSRIYATRFNTIADSLAMIEQNCQILLDKKLNESDPKLHLWLINHQQQQQQQQQQQNSSSSTTATDLSSDFLNETKLPKIMQYWSQESQRFYQINHNDYDDDEIYFSDEDEREQWYGHPDQWDRSKDILNKSPVQFEDAKEPPNSKGQKALWIGNVSPSCSLTFVTNLFMKFGNVTFCKIFPNEQRSPDVAYLLLHYDNDISPRLVMSYFKDKIVPGISKDDNCPLLIRFRNKNDKIDDQTSNDLTNLSSSSLSTTTGTISSLANGSNIISSSTTSGSNSPSSKTVSECYYFRTTGCDRQHCTFRHVIGNKGIDRQTWMRKKN